MRPASSEYGKGIGISVLRLWYIIWQRRKGISDVLSWPKSPYVFFHKIKDTFFIFTHNYWFGHFQYVSYLPCGIMLIVFNQCLDLIAINFNWSTWPWSIIQQKITSSKLGKPLLTYSISHSTFSIHCTNLCICFAFQLHFYLSWNKAYYAKNIAYFLPSSILKWLHKNSPIFIRVFKCMLIWQLSQYNLTKLFWMKLKTTKDYYSHLTENTKQTFWPTQ